MSIEPPPPSPPPPPHSPFLNYNFFKIWPWKSKVQAMGEVKIQSRIPFVPCHVATPLQVYRFFNLLLWKAKVIAQGHIVGPASHRLKLLLFFDNRPPIPVLWLFQHLTLKIRGEDHKPMILQKYRIRQFHRTFQHKSVQQFQRYVSIIMDPSGTWFSTWSSWITMMLHNYKSGQFHRTLKSTSVQQIRRYI